MTTAVQQLDAIRISEPRLEMIVRRLQALLRVVQLESEGEPIEVDGFRLRDPAMWLTPQTPAFSELWHISSACNMRCPFCYERADPECGSAFNPPEAMTTTSEMDSRLRLRDKIPGFGLFRPLTFTNEMFCNPRALELIERVREQSPGELLMFVTNGTYLTRAVVERLSRLRPLFFNFSVNSVSPAIRRDVLGDRHPERALAALELLREYEIPYVGSLVCWPTIPWDDIEATVRRLDQVDCAVIRYSLSAYGKHAADVSFDREEFWSAGVALARRLMAEVATPIKIEPHQYHDPTSLPNVIGAIRGSPAAATGLAAGDRIIAVDGTPTPTANHALSALSTAIRTRPAIELTVERAGHGRLDLAMTSDCATAYPYTAMSEFPGVRWGVVMAEGLRFGQLRMARQRIERAGAKRTLLCTSQLMRPIVEQMIADSHAFDGLDVILGVPENRHFGGTIILGDLLVVDDYVAFIDEFISSHGRVDLVLIPASPFSLGDWRRDLTGTPYREIERRTGVPVELIDGRPLSG